MEREREEIEVLTEELRLLQLVEGREGHSCSGGCSTVGTKEERSLRCCA